MTEQTRKEKMYVSKRSRGNNGGVGRHGTTRGTSYRLPGTRGSLDRWRHLGECHRRAIGSRQLGSEGSAIIEGVVALSIAFLMLAALVQASFALVVRHESKALVDQTARALTREGRDAAALIDELRRDLTAVTGDPTIDVAVTRSPHVEIRAGFEWTPPGPGWGSVPLTVDSNAYPVIRP